MKKEYHIAIVKFNNPRDCPFVDINGYCTNTKNGNWRLRCGEYDLNMKVHFPEECPLEKVIE